jgi:hypothetical protein
METEVLNIFLSIPAPCDLHNANLLLNVSYRTKHNTYVRPNILFWGGKSSNLQLRWAPCVHHVLPWWRWRWCSALFWFRNLCLYATKLRLIHFCWFIGYLHLQSYTVHGICPWKFLCSLDMLMAWCLEMISRNHFICCIMAVIYRGKNPNYAFFPKS